MATWEDGPEYAPLDPPDAYTVPDVAPLEVAPPPERPPAVPGERPQFGGPDDPVAPLAGLVPDYGADERDPKTPFDVDRDTMTAGNTGGAWGAAHWRPPAGHAIGQPYAGVPATPVGLWGPPTGPPAQSTAPMQLNAGPPANPGGLPAPGTPAWFGPGPTQPAPPTAPPSLWKATPPGAIIALAVSVIYPIAPISFLIGFILSARARYARTKILTGFAITTGAILMIATLSTVANYGDLTTWWSTLRVWSLFGALVMIVLILVQVNSELKNHRSGPGGPRPPGGPGWHQDPSQQDPTRRPPQPPW